MARMKVQGFEDIERQLSAVTGNTSSLAHDILEAGAQEYVHAWTDAIGSRGHVGTDRRNAAHLKDSVRVTRLEESAGGVWYAAIAPDGYDSRGVAQDLKANVINKKHDKSLKKAAEKAARPKAEAAMQAKLSEMTS